MEKHFDFKEREAALYEMWERSGAFAPEGARDQRAPVFNIAMPPPNANGELHLGHAFGYTLKDIFGRFHRLLGERVELLPGKDHAGIQTQVVFEKRLKAQGVDFKTMPPKELYQLCYDFCMDRSQYMRSQEKRLGISADWSRELFTLDPRLNEIVFDTFVRMYREGLVYRGKRIINWSVFSQTAISDVEVEYKEVEGGLWYLAYPLLTPTPLNLEASRLPADALVLKGQSEERLALISSALKSGTQVTLPSAEGEHSQFAVFSCEQTDFGSETLLKNFKLELSAAQREPLGSKGFIARLLPIFPRDKGLITATTRPETMLGDTALVVHPDDPRYADLIEARVKLPLTSRSIKVIADKRVDPTYGSGVIKVTPAHDFLDYDIGQDHKLEIIQVIGKDGRMTADAGAAFQGLTLTEARDAVIKQLDAEKLLISSTTITHKVPIGERGKDIIEPLVSEQWFVNVDKQGNSLKRRALELIRSGAIKIYPARFQALFEQWLENLRDWNISRQLWWGHQMPVWYRESSGNTETYVGTTPPEGQGWVQESDTFDTWFSSGQWAYSTFAAHKMVDLDNIKGNPWVPSHTMVMGRDILFFWACRMLVMTVYRLGTIPWKNIFFTGLIRDEHGQKMSKSKGNGIEPKELIEEFGTDSLRLGLVMGTSPGNDVSLAKRKIEGYSKFINKLWNAGKLVEMKLAPLYAETTLSSSTLNTEPELTLDSSKWMLAELTRLHTTVTQKLSEYEPSIAVDELYNWTWTTFCDWYLEMMKVLVDGAPKEQLAEVGYVASVGFRTILTMLHPFIPYITEELYQKLPFIQRSGEPHLMASSWGLERHVTEAKTEIPVIMEIVTAIRSVKAALAIPHKRIRISISLALSKESTLLITEMARADLCNESEIPAAMILRKPFSRGVIVCEVEGKENYQKRLEKDREAHRGTIAVLEKKLSGAFASQAKPELVQKERERLAQTQSALSEIERELAGL